MKSQYMFRWIFLFALIAFLSINLQAQGENPDYDQGLADSLGADEYGMKMYIFVILKTGPADIDDQDRVSELFRGHLDNIGRLAEMNKLIVAGPFKKNESNYRGLFVLNVRDLNEARKLLETDPAIEAKLLEPELYEWYGSAALPVYLETSKKISKKDP